MAQAAIDTAPDRLLELVPRLEAAQGFAEVVASLKAGHGATLDGVRGSSCALVAATLARHAPGPLVVVCPQPAEIDDFCDELALFTDLSPTRFPAWETLPTERTVHDEVFGDRLRVLKELGPEGRVQGSGFRVQGSNDPQRRCTAGEVSGDDIYENPEPRTLNPGAHATGRRETAGAGLGARVDGHSSVP
ncbi:MAG TPA: hypothetical protein VGX78_13260, partial [Pirellulales bacterium]|nr:hypothetical protein [Pirellulales bacterium]